MLNQASNIVFIVIGVYCIFRGIMLLMTGKLTPGEESGVRDLSPAGLKRFKLLTAVFNILAGLFISVMYVLRMLNLIQLNVYRIVAIACMGVLIVAYFIVRNSCKKL